MDFPENGALQWAPITDNSYLITEVMMMVHDNYRWKERGSDIYNSIPIPIQHSRVAVLVYICIYMSQCHCMNDGRLTENLYNLYILRTD